ncbi:OmpW family protein [Ideonella sp. B7]|uniref:OmpW/AlkL family protein n=1 Tax=Ideonella benzenivorans TaxID=2831643 RepID=UPI001CEC78C5|nr:OmpW family outer membrane protein [Ideonella benzenivorans]MCA6216162.1 OmpW family protein [Ideonella benzenivorans]
MRHSHNKSSHVLRLAAVAATLGLTGLAAHAEETPSWLKGWSVYLGGAYIDVNVAPNHFTTDTPTAVDNAQTAHGITAGLEVEDKATIGFGIVYAFSPKWSAELALGIPPEHSVKGTDAIQSFGQVALVKQAPPSAFLNYHFDELLPGFYPFVGLGVNYTKFVRTRSTQAGNAASGGPTKIKLSPSWGLTGHVGGTYKIDDHWSIVGTVAYADVKSTVTNTTEVNNGDGIQTVIRKDRLNFRPVVYTLSVGYAF